MGLDTQQAGLVEYCQRGATINPLSPWQVVAGHTTVPCLGLQQTSRTAHTDNALQGLHGHPAALPPGGLFTGAWWSVIQAAV